jgi:hypothetical protein
MAEFHLTTEILALSNAGTWDEAKLEWGLAEVYEAEKPETCLCGHFPIIELCIINNRLNRNRATVGNCCVKKFIGLPSDKIFQAVKRVRKDESRSLNGEAISHAHEKRWITEWECKFYFDVMRKRRLSPRQSDIKADINRKVLERMKRR